MNYEEEYAVKSQDALCTADEWSGCNEITPHVHVFICPSCDAVLAIDHSRGEALHPYGQWLPTMWAEITERDICYYCWEHDQERSSTIVRHAPDEEPTSVRFGDECIHTGDEGEDWFWDIFDKRQYVHTDGWRGFYDTKFEALEEVFAGWVTGDWDDVPWKQITHRFIKHLNENPPPVEVFVLFEPTSNLFSTACSVLVRKGDDDSPVEQFKTYVSETFDLYELERGFG